MADILSNLKGYWALDENGGSTAIDSSGTGNTGTISAATYTTGKVGLSALSFVPNAYVDVGTSATLQPTGDFTIAAWVKNAGSSSSESIFTTFDYGVGSVYNGYILRKQSDNSIQFTYYKNDLDAHPNPPNTGLLSTTLLNDGVWHHVAAVKSGSVSILYVDGVQENTATDSASPTYNGSPASSIGRLYVPAIPIGVQFWNGSIDEVRFYDRGLSSSDISALVAFTGAIGDSAITLGAATLSATASELVLGNLLATLGAATLSATGAELVLGNLSATLGAATLSATASELVLGNAAITLGAATLSSTASELVLGNASVTLGAATLSSTASEPVLGSAANTLGGLSFSFSGSVTSPAPTPTPTPSSGSGDSQPRIADSDNNLLRKWLIAART